MPPDQEEVDHFHYRQIEAASCLQALLLMGDFTPISAGDTQQGISNLGGSGGPLTTTSSEPTRRGALPGFLLTNSGDVEDVKVKGSIGYSERGMDPEGREEGSEPWTEGSAICMLDLWSCTTCPAVLKELCLQIAYSRQHSNMCSQKPNPFFFEMLFLL